MYMYIVGYTAVYILVVPSMCLRLTVYIIGLSPLEEGGGNFYGAMASKMGSAGAKLGKKVAQSEAGRSAGRAAIKGATDAAATDLQNRYFGEPDVTPKTTAPQPKKQTEKPTPSTSSKPQQPAASVVRSEEEAEYEQYRAAISYDSSRMMPPKPSLLSRFKPNINLSGGHKEQPKPRRTPSKKVYKYAASKEADWDQLPRAQALYNFRAEMKCDLEFRKGQIVLVTLRTDTQNDWWEGKIEDRTGIFPANYIKML